MVVSLPESLDRSNLEAFYSALFDGHEITESEKVVFDFSNCQYITPTGAAVLLAERDRMRENKVETWAQIRKSGRFYQFLKLFGMPLQSEIESAYKDRMEQLSVGVERCHSYGECLDVQEDVMEKIVRRTGCTEGTEAAVDYMINEIWDNAGVHGYECYETGEYPKPIYICAFSYRSSVEVAVVDRGRGIHSSLQRVPAYRNLSAKEALKRALENEVSGHPENSPGFGLYSAAQFILEGQGELSIWSSGRRLRLDNNGNMKAYGSSHRRGYGTVVSFEVDSGIEIPFEDVIDSKNVEDYLELVRGI